MTGAVDLRDQLNLIDLPTLVLHGDADPLVSTHSSRRLAETLPNGKLVILKGASHVAIMTRPKDVAGEISAFFKT